MCLGEGLAKIELFLFFVGLCQKFHFSTVDGVELSAEGVTGATRSPYPFQIVAKARPDVQTAANKADEEKKLKYT